MTCNCRICERHRKWDAALAGLTEEQYSVVNEIYCALACAEDEAAYLRAKHDGRWPGSATDTSAVVP